jgi:hypothetical protein
MKKEVREEAQFIMEWIVVLFSTGLQLWLFFAVGQWEWNPAKWGYCSRIGFAFLWAVLWFGAMIIHARAEEIREEKEKKRKDSSTSNDDYYP